MTANSIDITRREAVAKALRLGVPFVLYRNPGEDPVFFADPVEGDAAYGEADTSRGEADSSCNVTDAARGVADIPGLPLFEIGAWLEPYSRRTTIRPRLLAEDFLKADIAPRPAEGFEPQYSATREEYLSDVEQIAERCSKRGGKTVYSRVITGTTDFGRLPDTAMLLFEAFPQAFGFLYYTPRTGLWLGATPETLLDYDFENRRASTMAFAGTRPDAADTPWDEKNLRENLYVADFIRDCFLKAGAECSISAPYSSPYGAIQHLRRDISAVLPSRMSFEEIFDALNPTPALCGTPRESAIADIERFERHKRHCYGGFVALHNPGKSFSSYVNLRSCRISPEGKFNLYAGGGIIGESLPETEYAETEAKASRLLSLLTCRP